MNIFLFFLIISPGSRLSTSFYTFHKLGGYSVSDLYSNYAISRYNMRMVLEKRQALFGLKSFGIEIDSVLKDYRLVIGEKPYYLNAPFSTALDLWGITLSSQNIVLLLGKTKDPTSVLPPTFQNNNYTVGFKLQRNFSYRVPLEFYFLKKNDNQGKILDNNSFGINTKVGLAENLNFTGQFGANISNIGFGTGFSLGGTYTGQRYGAQAYFRKIFSNYVTPSNLSAEPGNWFQLTTYSRPLYWLNLGHEISYSSLKDVNLGLNFAINKAPLPDFGYGVSFSRRTESISQNIHSVWRYKKFSIAGDYGWSKQEKNFGLKLSQGFKNLQFWSGLQIKNATIYQFGGNFPISTKLRFKSFFNIIQKNSQVNNSKGFEISINFLKNFNLNSTYELIQHENINDHFLSLSISNTMLFDQVGFSFVSGRVFMDLNNNGIFDVEDQVISDIEVVLDEKNIAKTDKNGNYLFPFVRGGEHNVSLNLGCLPAEIGTEKRRYVVDTKFLTRARVHFPLGELGIIEGIVFYDENKNGKMDKDEKGVPNVVLGLNGYLSATDISGKFRFANLVSGSYGLEVKVLPPETFLSIPELSYIYITPGEKFSNYQIGIIKKERPVEKKVFEEPEIFEEKPPPEIKPKPKPIKKATEEEIKKLFNQGVSYFISEKYDDALKMFNQVLVLDQNHKGARDYKKRTETRLEALKE